jgi:hypothetical protein
MKTMLRILPLLLLATGTSCFLPVPACAQGGIPLWTNRYNGPANGFDEARAILADGDGNVFVTGSSYNGSNDDYATIKYSSGGLPLWTNRFDGPGSSNDYARAIAVDANGDVYVTGYSYSIPSGDDYATVKYSNAGVSMWTNYYSGPGIYYDYAQALAVDSNGNVFVTGSSSGGASGADYATIKYSSTGMPLWTNRYQGPSSGAGPDQAVAVGVDMSGNVYVTGDSSGGVSVGSDFATIKYSNNGVAIWTNRYSGPGDSSDIPKALAIDGGGNVFITGYSRANGTGTENYATVAYLSSGLPWWTNYYNGPGSASDEARAIGVNTDSTVFVTGLSFGVNSDYATIAYSMAGTPLWTNRYNGPGNQSDFARALAVDAGGNVVVTGRSYGAAFDLGDYATIKYSSSGIPLWTNRYPGPTTFTEDGALAIAVDANNDVIVTGISQSGTPTETSDYATIKYRSGVLPSIPLQVEKVGDEVVLSWTNAEFGLQSASSVSSTFTNVPGATSPHTNSITGSQQFFRLRAN